MSRYPQIFYTSDLHIGHKFVAGTRGFMKPERAHEVIDFNNKSALPAGVREWTDPEAHNNWLADIWEDTVREIDIVYILGDMSMSGDMKMLEWIKERPGKKNLIAGNHDPVHPSNHDSERLMQLWRPYFNDIQAFSRRRLGGHEILMSHFPYSGRGAEGHGVVERHTQYRFKDMGMPLLHGHTHGKEKTHFSDRGTPQLHVGIDSWGRFIHQDEVITWLQELYPPSYPRVSPSSQQWNPSKGWTPRNPVIKPVNAELVPA